ncbi:hypothetical protein HQN89_33430 [Paenibacillus frigoriresistens]|uniref:cell envelope integrity protein TolA n=1 Tax=Paenibacillus alginolyticus TaxID=59839 RepID=UPI001564A9C2|nr:hypothetical protein [Paenibacillus frigoriresistens]NRF95731.1 hypothetical protein [Paenibacillus frigoriresistens]
MVNKIPGFRTNRKRNKVIGSIGYSIFVIGMLIYLKSGQTPIDSLANELTWFIIFLGLYIPIANPFNFRNKIFLTNRKSILGKILGYTVYFFCCMIIAGITASSLQSDKEKAFRAADNAKRQEAKVAMAKVEEQKKADEDKKKQEDEQRVEADAKAKAENDSKIKADKEAQAKLDQEAKIKADANAKAKKEEEAKARAIAEEEKVKNPIWNVKDLHVDKNGNLALAVKMLKAIGDIPQGTEAAAGDVLKTPWNYYGKPIKFTGTIGIVQDYPPGSDFAKSGIISQIVFNDMDGTIIDLFSTVASGKLKVGNQFTVVAYPIGQVEVENKFGGKTTQLAVVTSKVE